MSGDPVTNAGNLAMFGHLSQSGMATSANHDEQHAQDNQEEDGYNHGNDHTNSQMVLVWAGIFVGVA